MPKHVRVGDPESIVQPGDLSPEGKLYSSGQFAPTIDELVSETISEASQAGLISRDLPIFNEQGEVDETRLNDWQPINDLVGMHITVSPSLSKYTAAGMVSILKIIGKNRYIDFIREDNELLQDSVVAAQTSRQGKNFLGGILVSSKFYELMVVPVIPKIVGRTQGVSLATLLTFHSLGHLLYARLGFDGRVDLLGKFAESSGWRKSQSPTTSQGTFLTFKNRSSWNRDTNIEYPSETSKWSPMDDFAQTYAHYYLNSAYLKNISPKRYENMESIIQEY